MERLIRISINRDTVLFDSFVDNYWGYFRELEKEFMETQKYVEFIFEKSFMDMVGTYDDLPCFMDFSNLFVRRKRYTYAQMDELLKVK